MNQSSILVINSHECFMIMPERQPWLLTKITQSFPLSFTPLSELPHLATLIVHITTCYPPLCHMGVFQSHGSFDWQSSSH